MKNYLFLIMLLVIVACDSNREVTNPKFEHGEKDLSSKSMPNSSLCLTVQQPVMLYGNQGDYPKIRNSSYYSLIEPSSKLSWFYLQAYPVMRSYINNKYNKGNKESLIWAVNSSNIPDLGTLDVDYVKFSRTVAYYEQQTNSQLFPDRTLTPEVSSYVVYRVLSQMDEYAKDYYVDYNVRLTPIGITFFHDHTMCGDYLGLLFNIYYRIN